MTKPSSSYPIGFHTALRTLYGGSERVYLATKLSLQELRKIRKHFRKFLRAVASEYGPLADFVKTHIFRLGLAENGTLYVLVYPRAPFAAIKTFIEID